MFRSHLAGIVPGQELIDLTLHVAGRDSAEGSGQSTVIISDMTVLPYGSSQTHLGTLMRIPPAEAV